MHNITQLLTPFLFTLLMCCGKIYSYSLRKSISVFVYLLSGSTTQYPSCYFGLALHRNIFFILGVIFSSMWKKLPLILLILIAVILLWNTAAILGFLMVTQHGIELAVMLWFGKHIRIHFNLFLVVSLMFWTLLYVQLMRYHTIAP